MKYRPLANAYWLMIALFVTSCVDPNPTHMTITNIEQSNKAIVFVDASVHRENLLVSGNNDTNTIYATRNE